LIAAGRRSRSIMLTAAGAMDDVVEGHSLGADDDLPKPFDFPGLVARIRALSRRAQPAVPPVVCRGDLRVDTGQRRAWRGDRSLDRGREELGVRELRPGAGAPPFPPRTSSTGSGTNTPPPSPPPSRSPSAGCAASSATRRSSRPWPGPATG